MYVDAEQSGKKRLDTRLPLQSREQAGIGNRCRVEWKKAGQQAFIAEWRAGRFMYADAEQSGKKGWTGQYADIAEQKAVRN